MDYLHIAVAEKEDGQLFDGSVNNNADVEDNKSPKGKQFTAVPTTDKESQPQAQASQRQQAFASPVVSTGSTSTGNKDNRVREYSNSQQDGYEMVAPSANRSGANSKNNSPDNHATASNSGNLNSVAVEEHSGPGLEGRQASPLFTAGNNSTGSAAAGSNSRINQSK
jgi:hypothetical protein